MPSPMMLQQRNKEWLHIATGKAGRVGAARKVFVAKIHRDAHTLAFHGALRNGTHAFNKNVASAQHAFSAHTVNQNLFSMDPIFRTRGRPRRDCTSGHTDFADGMMINSSIVSCRYGTTHSRPSSFNCALNGSSSDFTNCNYASLFHFNQTASSRDTFSRSMRTLVYLQLMIIHQRYGGA